MASDSLMTKAFGLKAQGKKLVSKKFLDFTDFKQIEGLLTMSWIKEMASLLYYFFYLDIYH